MDSKGQLWVVVGATGTGKSALSLDLAETLGNAEIVNADAMQFYRGMNIGTAKLPEADRRGIPHHLFDSLDVTEEATVAWYQPTARELIEAKLAQGIDMILVGGSGLYVSSVIYNFQFPPRDEQLRAELEERASAEGIEALVQQLTEVAPEVAAVVDTQNPRRVIRALEIALLGGEAQVELPEAPELWCPDTRIIGVHAAREVLVPRLEARVLSMWQDGLLEEVRGLIPQGITHGPTASRAIGYAQAIAHLNGDATELEAITETQALTRRYARRQVSWFKRYRDVDWLDAPDVRRVKDLAT